jgi:hypothetical protein
VKMVILHLKLLLLVYGCCYELLNTLLIS